MEHKNKPRVALSIPEASEILEKHRLNGKHGSCTNIKYLDKVFSWRNSSYVITNSERKEYFLRFSENWGGKCENERAVISLLRTRCPSLPVPEVLGFQTNFEVPGEKEKFDYILFQKLPGVPLGDVFKNFSLSDKKKIVTSIVNILFQLQQLKFDKIGSFKFTSGGEVEIGPDFILEDGPFDTYLDYYKALITHGLGKLSTCPYLLEELDFDILKQRIENFGQKISTGKDAVSETVKNVPFVFTHLDFHAYNLLVDRDRMEITGLIDFEFSGSYQLDQEMYNCCYFVALDSGAEPTSGPDPDENTCSKFECSSKKGVKEMRAFFLEECHRQGVRTPQTIPGFRSRTKLHDFARQICPWWIREAERKGEQLETLGKKRDKARKWIFGKLAKYKC